MLLSVVICGKYGGNIIINCFPQHVTSLCNRNLKQIATGDLTLFDSIKVAFACPGVLAALFLLSYFNAQGNFSSHEEEYFIFYAAYLGFCCLFSFFIMEFSRRYIIWKRSGSNEQKIAADQQPDQQPRCEELTWWITGASYLASMSYSALIYMHARTMEVRLDEE